MSKIAKARIRPVVRRLATFIRREHPMSDPIVWRPSKELVAKSNLMTFLRHHGVENYESLLARAEREPAWWWQTVADQIAFYRNYDRILDTDQGPEFARWCVGGTTNIVLNAL